MLEIHFVLWIMAEMLREHNADNARSVITKTVRFSPNPLPTPTSTITVVAPLYDEFKKVNNTMKTKYIFSLKIDKWKNFLGFFSGLEESTSDEVSSTSCGIGASFFLSGLITIQKAQICKLNAESSNNDERHP